MEIRPPAVPGESPVPPGPPRRAGKLPLFLVFALAALGGFFLYRRVAATKPPTGAAASPAPGALIASAPVRLNPKAVMIADRFNCLCGECHDTLGACTCTRDKGSNEMKATLNKIVEEKRTLPQIEAAMVARYGPRVLASPPPSAPQPASQ